MIYVTHRHMEGGEGHEHIADVKWRNPSTENTGESARAAVVDWIENKGGDARVQDGASDVKVGVVHPTHGTPYLRTHADGKWTDNLLALPTY